MIGPQKLEKAPVEVVKLMAQLQEWTITDIARRIATSTDNVLTSSAEFQLSRLSEMQLFNEDLKKKLTEVTSLSDNEIEKLYQDAAEANYIYDKRLFNEKGIPFVPFEENVFMQRLASQTIEQTKGDMYNITQSLGFAVRGVDGNIQFKPIAQFYQDTLDLATLQVATGVADFQTVIRQAVDRMASSGLRTIDYASGWNNRVEVAARRAIFNGMRNLTNSQSEYNAQVMGVTTFEISWHGGHRPSHGWGGKRFDTTGKLYPTEQELYQMYGGGTLNDYNCYHEKYAVFPEAPYNHSESEIAELEAEEQRERVFEGKAYNAYEARQQQRKLETSMRNVHLRAAGYKAAGLNDEYLTAKTLYARHRQIYKDFSGKMGLPTQYERLYGPRKGSAKEISVGISKANAKQYENLKSALGKNAPTNIEEFLNLKSGKEWPQYKAYARSVKSGSLTSLADFKLYKETSKSIQENLIGATTKNGIMIQSHSDHFVDRMIGSVEQRRSGVSIDDVREALMNPRRLDLAKENKNGKSQRFIGEKAIVTVNPDTGNMIQANPARRK